MTYPAQLSRADFLNRLQVQDVRFFLGRQDQINGLGGGEILKAEVAPALWRGQVMLAPMRSRAMAEFEGLLAYLEAPGRTFLAYKSNQIGPAADPLGAELNGYTPAIHAVDTATSEITLTGLPNTYEISPGDLIGFPYDGNRVALHRYIGGGTAGSLGRTPALQVVPHLRPGATTGTAVRLVRASCVALTVPGGVDYGTTRNGITSGVSFQFQQSLR